MWLDDYFEPFTLFQDMIEAKQKHKETLKTNPNNTHALTQLVLLTSLEWDEDSAYDYGNQLLKCNPASYELFELYHCWAKMELGQKQFEKALKNFHKLEEINEADEEVYYKIAGCYAYLKKFEEADKYMVMALSKFWRENQTTCYMWEDAGQLFGVMERHDDALNIFQARLKDDPNNWYVLYAIGLCFQNKGDDLRALNYYYKSLENDATVAATYNNLAAVANNLQGKIGEAIQFLEKALEVVDDDDSLKGTIYLNLSKLHRRLSNYEKAEEYKAQFLKSLGFEVEWVEDDEEEEDGEGQE